MHTWDKVSKRVQNQNGASDVAWFDKDAKNKRDAEAGGWRRIGGEASF